MARRSDQLQQTTPEGLRFVDIPVKLDYGGDRRAKRWP